MATAEEDVLKRLQGIKDSRGLVGEMARGKNMYPGGNNAHSGPGGPEMGRPPTAISPDAVQAVMQQTGHAAPPQVTSPPQVMPMASTGASKRSPSAMQQMQAAAQRRLQRGR